MQGTPGCRSQGRILLESIRERERARLSHEDGGQFKFRRCFKEC
jgi:hypothetical protein